VLVEKDVELFPLSLQSLGPTESAFDAVPASSLRTDALLFRPATCEISRKSGAGHGPEPRHVFWDYMLMHTHGVASARKHDVETAVLPRRKCNSANRKFNANFTVEGSKH
jgi:hypothetical protein